MNSRNVIKLPSYFAIADIYRDIEKSYFVEIRPINTKYHHGDNLRAIVFKMSDKPEDSDSKQSSREGERDDSSKPTLKDATHKLKAEALRRLQLGDAEYESEGAKNSEAREGSSQNDDSNIQDTGIGNGDRSEIQSDKSDVSIKEKENNVDVSDRNGVDSNIDETIESGGLSQDSAKPNDISNRDSASGDIGDTNRQTEQGLEISASEGDKTSSEVKDQSINERNASSRQGENAKQVVSDKTSSKDTRPLRSQGQEGASRPGSGGARPGSRSEGAGKGEGSQQKPSSRPGSGSNGRFRPGSESKRSRQERQSSSRPGSGTGSKARPQSGHKGDAAGSEGGSPGQDESSSGGVAEGSRKKDGASVGDGINKTSGDLSQSKTSKGEEDDGSAEGTPQTLGADSAEQGKKHHGDASNPNFVDNKSTDDTTAQNLSPDNKSESKQTGDDGKISDEVSPPMNKGAESKDQDVDSKQISDSLSNDKQDSGEAEAGKDVKEGARSDNAEGDKENASTSDRVGQGDTKSGDQKDVLEVSQQKEVAKDKNATEGQEGEAKAGDKDGSGADTSGDGKPSGEAQEADTAKSGDVESDKSGVTQTDHGDGDKGDTGESSGKQPKGKKGDAAADTAEGQKEDGSEKKKKKKKSKKESTEQEEDLEDEEDEEAEEAGKTDGEPQPSKPSQSAPGTSRNKFNEKWHLRNG